MPIPRPQILEGFRRDFGVEIAETAVADAVSPLPGSQPENQCLPFRDIEAVYTGRDGIVRLAVMQWQLIHHWNREFRSDYTNFNTRFESLGKPHNRDLLCHRRCVVPVAGFFENRQAGGRAVKPRDAYRFTLRGQEIIPLGGIYSVWINPDDDDDRRLSCSIITLEPNEIIGEIHNRMPFIIPREAVATWLDPAIDDFDLLTGLIRPVDSSLLARAREGAA